MSSLRERFKKPSYQPRTGLLQFIIFLVLAAVIIPYGISFVAGPEGFRATSTLKAKMTDAFGLTAGTGVTLRGVDIGTVKSVALNPDGSGADIALTVRGDVDIPAESYLQVTMASMAGIQSVDILPTSDTGPYLRSGDSIAAPADKQPQQMDEIIVDAAKIIRAIDTGSISTIGTELYQAVNSDPDAFSELIRNGTQLARLVNDNAPLIKGLLGDWLTTLDAMSDTSRSFQTGMRTMATFTDQLDANQPVFIHLLDRSPAALTHATELFDRYRGTFGGVLANLAIVEPIIAERDAALATGLNTIPQGLIDLRSIVKNNRADFTLVGTQGPVCMFYDEPRRMVGDFSPSHPNLARYCPAGDGYGQRGALNAPRPNDLGTEHWTDEGGVSGPPAVTDPLLIPNGAELLEWWSDLLERARSGN